MSVDVIAEVPVPLPPDEVVSLVRHVLHDMRIHPAADVTVMFVDEDAIATLHVQWLDEPGPTDVMSFPMDELRPTLDDDETPEQGILGDIVVCPAVAVRQAATAGHTVADEVQLLITHGLLHLMGYDHLEPADEAEMFSLQADLLQRWRAGRYGPMRFPRGSGDPSTGGGA